MHWKKPHKIINRPFWLQHTVEFSLLGTKEENKKEKREKKNGREREKDRK
jgi:hypothetical protein